jgi:hypothetical protein
MPAPARTLGNWNLGPRANCEWRIPLLVALVGCSARTLPSSIAVGGRESAACANGEGLQYYAPLYLEAEATDGAAPNAIPMSADQLAEALIRLSGPASEFSSSLWRAFRTDARSGSTSRNATTPGAWALRVGRPRFPSAGLDIISYQSPHDLRRCQIFLCTQALEQFLLAWVNQDGKASGAIFCGQMRLTLSDMSMHIRL